MTVKMKRSVQQMIDEARKHIDNHTPEEAKRRVDEEGALLLDVRDIRELERDGVIPGAMHTPRGMLEFWIDPESPYFRKVFNEDREFILYCAGGGRTSLSAKTLKDLGLERVSHIVTGFGGWKEAGLPVVDHHTWRANR